MAKKTSLADIAKSLGVSKTLVSLVLNNKADQYGINRETQERVRERIKEMNYQPDVLARVFRTGKTQTIGLIVSDIANPFYAALARHIEDLAWEEGYGLVICSTDENTAKEEQQVRLLMERKTDGLIISSSREGPEAFHALAADRFPHVLVDRVFPGLKSPFVSADNFWGASMVATHLLEQGIREIGMITTTPAHISTIRDREQGFTSTLLTAGVEIPARWSLNVPFGSDSRFVEESLGELARAGDLPRAIFTLNNRLTASCLFALRALNLQIPRDVALVGFDDMPWFAHSSPAISAVSQPVKAMGEQAFQMLLRQLRHMEDQSSSSTVHLPVELHIRGSSLVKTT
jgi:LacI family transcriptional regulator